MALKFYSKSVPFWVKAGHFYFFITCLLSVILMKNKLNIIEEYNGSNPQYFESLTQFVAYGTSLGKEHAQLRVFYEVDFVFMFGYTGWFLFFVFLVNQLKKQPKWLNILFYLLIFITLFTDIYENTRLLLSMCSIDRFSEIHTTFCTFSSGKDYFNSYYHFNYWMKYSAALAFAVLYLVVYLIARRKSQSQ
jgi:hypothetical protein